MLKIASWNVNSLNVRLPQVLAWSAVAQPDVLALQETKLTDDRFPVEELRAAGYHSLFSGQKTYNGVAILSRHAATDPVTDIPGLDDHQRRILAATVGEVRVVNLYVVNGSEVGSEKFDYKLQWLHRVTDWLADELLQHPNLVVLGDFNIAPDDRDVLGDTWWATPTSRFPWHADDAPRPLGPDAGFKDFVRRRRQQGFNCIALIAALPNWANDGHSATLRRADGTFLRSAWREAGTDRAKNMTNVFGHRAFLFPGRVPGLETVFPDVERLNPAYFQTLDRKMDYLNAQGFIPFMEVTRRDIGQAWKTFYPWPQSYVRYIQYVWSRYQAHIALFSPIHFDTPAESIPC